MPVLSLTWPSGFVYIMYYDSVYNKLNHILRLSAVERINSRLTESFADTFSKRGNIMTVCDTRIPT